MKPEHALNEKTLKILGDVAGIYDFNEWLACWLLVSKSEHDNEKPEKTFIGAKGESVFKYADFLPYDWTERGVTCGLVGFTSANCGKDAWGDLQPVLKILKKRGGPDLLKYADSCHKDKASAKKLCKKIHGLDDKDFDLFVEAQFEALIVPGGYIFETVNAWKKVGVENPSMLAIATVFDTSLNQGHDGKDGGCKNLIKIGKDHKGDEDKILEKYNDWRRKVAGSTNYNSCRHNGENRSDMFDKLRGKKFTVDNVIDVIGWKMK